MDTIIINNKPYKYYIPNSYQNRKLLEKQKKGIKEKIKACQSGCYKGKVSRNGTPYYSDYPELLAFLENLK